MEFELFVKEWWLKQDIQERKHLCYGAPMEVPSLASRVPADTSSQCPKQVEGDRLPYTRSDHFLPPSIINSFGFCLHQNDKKLPR